jgi:hypothetical protein
VETQSYQFVSENTRDDAGEVRRAQLRDERIVKMKASETA